MVLFDIDGTLLHAGALPRRAFGEALRETFGTVATVDDHPFAGKTDPQIAREVLRAAGIVDREIEAGLPALFDAYLTRLQLGLGVKGDAPRVLPGVVALLDALCADRGVVLGLLTGNLARGAELKLEAAGLGGRFAFGAYGSDSAQRPHLPAFALARAEASGVRVGSLVVVGDTPLDVACGRAAGARTVAVATGGFGVEELTACGADVVLHDFEDTTRAVAALLG
ncbi:MAG TPA: HAD family hydrolase [Longimicrobiales bacterium]|nr:HAD family hydrolase [Longimicrobiales bacterium]